jgi:hypothetical protein
VIAQAGFGLSVVRFALVCCGVNWPGLWATWGFVLLLIGLLIVDWQKADRQKLERSRRLPLHLRVAWYSSGAAFCIFVAIIGYCTRFHHPMANRIANTSLIATVFSLEVLSLTYGQEQSADKPLKA